MRILTGIAALAMAAASPAAAQVLDFNTGGFFLTNGQSADAGQGFTVSLSGATGSGFAFVDGGASVINNGTPKVFLANNGILSFSRAAETPGGFSVLSLEVGGSFVDNPNRWANDLTFTGNLLGGGSVTSNFVLNPQLNALSLVTLSSGFTGLESFSITPSINALSPSPNNFEFTLDNLAFSLGQQNVVPEPGVWLQLIAGFGLVGLVVRRRRTSLTLA